MKETKKEKTEREVKEERNRNKEKETWRKGARIKEKMKEEESEGGRK